MLSESTHILDLPPEILVNIIDKLPYNEIDTVRPACSAFNNAGKYLKRIALHRMRTKADCAMRKCQARLKNAEEPRVLRASRGEFSVRCLSGIIQVVDLATLPFVLTGALPPIPTILLMDVDKALQIAYTRSMIGRNRLRQIYNRLNKYLMDSMSSIHTPLSLGSLFHCVVNLLYSLPHVTYSLVPMDYGVYCLLYLDLLMVSFNSKECYSPAALVVMTLAKLNFRSRMQDYINQDGLFSLMREKGRNDSVMVNHIELMVQCDACRVDSLGQIRLVDPMDFQVVVYWTSEVPADCQPNIEELGSYRYIASVHGCAKEDMEIDQT